MFPSYAIGLATTFHDPAVAIVNPAGEIVFAEATERFLQSKRAFNSEPDPLFRITELLDTYCVGDATVRVATTWSRNAGRLPFWAALLHMGGLLRPEFIQRWRLDRLEPTLLLRQYDLWHMLLCVHSSHMKAGANLARALRHRQGQRQLQFLPMDHHRCHAAMACYTSPFPEAVCLIVDGTGDVGSLTGFHYTGGRLLPIARHAGRESLGALFMLVTELCGFSAFAGEEWKVMGLAAYGRHDPALYDLFRTLLRVEDLSLRHPVPAVLRATVQSLERYRRPANAPPEAAADLACTWQKAFSDLLNELLRNVFALGLSRNLVLAGGCALNSSYAGQVLAHTGFTALHIPSAPADDGAALGAALLARVGDGPLPQRADSYSPYLGTAIGPESVQRLQVYGPVGRVRHCPGRICAEAAQLLAQGRIVGWVQGRAEFGPRALGNRSILADPRQAAMKDRLNAQVKFREEYRPFAPAVLHELGPRYFEDYQFTPYMERTLRFRPEVRECVPAVVHVDGTGRLQSVTRELNARFHALITAFHDLTGVPILLNTSFNVMGKPIIHTVEDALGVFYTSGLDALVIDDYIVVK